MHGTSRWLWGLLALALTLPLAPALPRALAAPQPQAIGANYADYDAELREATPRSDGIYHVDTPRLIARLQQAHVTTYAFLVWHAETDWDDFRLEFLPAAQQAGLTVWLYLTPPNENNPPEGYVPYGTNYVTWATETAKLAQQYPVLTGLAIDDFNSNESFFTPAYVGQMMSAAHAIAPNLAFLPVNYDVSANRPAPTLEISPAFAAAYGGLIGGVIFPYMHWANMSRRSDEWNQIIANNDTLPRQDCAVRGQLPLGPALPRGRLRQGRADYQHEHARRLPRQTLPLQVPRDRRLRRPHRGLPPVAGAGGR